MKAGVIVILGAIAAAGCGLWIGYASGERNPPASELEPAPLGNHSTASLIENWNDLGATEIRKLLRTGHRDFISQHLLVLRLAQVDPDQAFGFVLKYRRGEERLELLKLVVNEWVKSDPDTAVQSTRWLDDPRLRHHAIHTAVRGLLDLEPLDEFIARLKRLELPFDKFESDVALWLREHPETSIDAIRNLPDSGGTLVLALAHGIAKRDVDEALRWIESSGLTGNQRAAAFQGVLGELANTDADAALRYYESLEHGDADWGGQPWIREIAASDPLGTLEWLSGLPEARRTRVLQSALDVIDPEIARKHIDLVPPTRWTKGLINRFVDGMRRKPEDVRAWAESLDDGFAKSTIYERFARVVPPSDLPAAYAEIVNAPEGALPSSYAAAVASRRAIEDPDTAMGWLAEIPPHHREIATVSFLESLAARQPDKAIEHLSRLPEEGYLRAAATARLARRWLHPQEMAKGHNKLTRLLESLTTDIERRAALNEIDSARRLDTQTAGELRALLGG